MKQILAAVILIVLASAVGSAQTYNVGGRLGFSTFDSDAGLQIGVTGDYQFRHDMAVGTEFNINTQGGTPVEWGNTFKYFIDMPSGTMKPYVDGGFNIWFVTGGPYFGLRFGGGMLFPIAPNLSIPADVQLGPVFSSGSSTFYLAITSGIRYTLP